MSLPVGAFPVSPVTPAIEAWAVQLLHDVTFVIGDIRGPVILEGKTLVGQAEIHHNPTPQNPEPHPHRGIGVYEVPAGTVLPSPSIAPRVAGCDVSAFQTNVDWEGVASSGRLFAYCKATEGMTYVSPRYTAQAVGAKLVGLMVGAYHFFSTRSSPADQMAAFFRVARSLEFALDLPLALDVEEQAHDPLGGVSADEYADRVRACLDEMVSESNRRPVMYCSPGFLARLPDRDFASVADLWVADYNPRLVLPHGFTEWKIWQVSGNRKIAGTEMDDDVFNGSADDLRSWASGS